MSNTRIFLAALVLTCLGSQAVAAEDGTWSSSDIASLTRWVDSAPSDALPRLSTDALEAARRSEEAEAIDAEANALALDLARMHLLGNASPSERSGWHIPDSDIDLPLPSMLANAVANDTLDTFFALMRPGHPEYSALREAFNQENDRERRETIARNMERWRWMPRSLGPDYVIVNAARFRAEMWRGGDHAGTWRIIVGTTRTPTPVFQATIEGVVLNPWWEIPASIVRESVGALVRNNPSLARSRGYVVQNGRYRQRPGPNNALGQMKLVMPNPYSVYMHDTPNRQLFEEEVRSFSHGCIRTGDAIGFAATLLEGAKTRPEIDAILASQQTTTIPIVRPMPVYITYFTAVSDGAGDILMLDDIYNRDGRISVQAGMQDTHRGLRAAALGASHSRGDGTEVEC